MTRGDKTDQILTILFMTLALTTVISFFAVSDRTITLYCGGAAILLRMIQYFLRFIH